MYNYEQTTESEKIIFWDTGCKIPEYQNPGTGQLYYYSTDIAYQIYLQKIFKLRLITPHKW